MLNLKQGEIAVKLARNAIESFFKRHEMKISDKVFYEKRGVFVTLHNYPGKELRGCIGFPYPTFPLRQAIADAAKAAAFNDPRFFPLAEKELGSIIIEVSVLTLPEKIKAEPKSIKIGKDGLICSLGNYSGLLLPQVASEQKWNARQFLENTCIKAGLQKDSWLEKECVFYRFQAQIFSEEKPNGKLIKKA